MSELERGFLNPPDMARPRTWWHWMNGNISEKGILLDIEAMREIGLGGFQLFDATCGIPGGSVRYNSEEWHKMLTYTLQKAEILGLEMTFHNCAGWSTSGGPWITPEQSMKKLVWTEMQVAASSARESFLQLEKPEAVRGFYTDIKVIAFPTPVSETNEAEGFRLEDWRTKGGHAYLGSMWVYKRNDRPGHDPRSIAQGDTIPLQSIIDLSDKMMENGLLQWEAPSGDWTVLRFGYTSTGKTNHPAPEEGTGLECDKLSRDGAEAHWKGIIDGVINTGGNYSGQTLNSILIDSYEAGAQNWTDNFDAEFLSRRGYDLFRYFPSLTGRVVENIQITERFLWDFRRTIADLFSDCYYGHFEALCEKNGLNLYVQPYGRIGNFDELSNAGRGHIPMGEFWVNRYDFGMAYSSKLAASAAHVQGKKLVASESFTAGHKEAAWISHPYSLKALGDHFFCMGINRFYFAEFAHQPWSNLKPGMTLGPFGFQFNRANTWWSQSRAWISYLSRIQHLLQQGDFVADLCYYFGENVPNTLPNLDALQPRPPRGYDYDALITGFFPQLEVIDGKLSLPGGMKYRVLVLPHFERTILPEVLIKLRNLVMEGAVVVGPRPIISPSLAGYPACDNQIRQIADELWGKTDGKDKTLNKFGKGRVYWGRELIEVLSDLGIRPDFNYSGDNDPEVEYIHRRTEDADIYFISNQEHRYISIQCDFRLTGKLPEIWNPYTGEVQKIAHYQVGNGFTRIYLSIGPAESLLILFKSHIEKKLHITEAQIKGADIHGVASLGKAIEWRIIEASYGIPDDPSSTIEVTQQLTACIDNDYLRIVPGRIFNYDPVPGSDKVLVVKYELAGKEKVITVPQGGQLVIPDQPTTQFFPAASLVYQEKDSVILQAWKNGLYKMKLSNGTSKTVNIDHIPVPMEIRGPWTINFPKGWGAPESINIDELMSWTDHSDSEIRHFSGTAVYQKEIDIPAGMIMRDQSLWLDLGRVYNMAEVFVNGLNLGTCWAPPYGVNVTEALKQGRNMLEVRVTNLWPNRLIGDEEKTDPRPFAWNKRWRALLPVEWETWQELAETEERKPGEFARNTGRHTWSTVKFYEADDPLLESGMIGPVVIYVQKKKTLS